MGYIFSIAIAVLGLSAALFGTMAGDGRTSQGHVCRGYLLRVRIRGGGCWRGDTLFGAHLSRLRSDRWRWARAGLYLTGLNADQVVPRPAGTGYGLGDHGLRRRCDDRFAAGDEADGVYSAFVHPIAATWVTMSILYFVFMMFGVFTIRVPGEGWKPEGWVPRATRSALISTHRVDVNAASRTPQFWLLWLILCMNVTAGIGILEQASPMIQDLFHGHVTVIAAAGFVGLLSLFNMGGRFVWASMSDFIGRKTTYFVFFVVGMLLYLALPFNRVIRT